MRLKTLALGTALLTAAVMAPQSTAEAQDSGTDSAPTSARSAGREMGTRNWTDRNITIGLGTAYEPVSPGVDEYEFELLPFVDIEYLDRFFLKSERGLGAYVLRSQGGPEYGFGFAIGYDAGREESDARRELDGLGDIDPSAEAIFFAEGELGPVELELELAQGLGSDGHGGFRGEVSAGIEAPAFDRLVLGAGPFLTFADSQYMGSYYGVTSGQAARSSRFERYDADGGLESYGIEATARVKLTQNWSLIGFAAYTRLAGDAKDSPIVENEGFFSGGAIVAYTF